MKELTYLLGAFAALAGCAINRNGLLDPLEPAPTLAKVGVALGSRPEPATAAQVHKARPQGATPALAAAERALPGAQRRRGKTAPTALTITATGSSIALIPSARLINAFQWQPARRPMP